MALSIILLHHSQLSMKMLVKTFTLLAASPRARPRQTPRQEFISRCPTATHQSLPDRILSGQSLVVVFPNYLRHDLLYAFTTAMPAPVYKAHGHCLVLLKRRTHG